MKDSGKSSLSGYGLILLSAVLFGTYGVWSRLMGPSFQPFYQAWVRSIIIMLIMLPFMIKSKSFRRIEQKDWPQVGMFIAFCICTQVPLYYAFNHAPIGSVQLIFYSVFIITAYIVGRFYLGEKITRVKIAAMILALVGLAIVFGAAVLAFAPIGLALAAFNGVASGGETASTKKVSHKYSPALLVFWGWVFTAITHLPISLLLGEKQVMPQFNHAWLWLVIYSIVNAAAFWLAITGYKHVDASIASLVGLAEVIFAIIFGAIIFHQKITLSMYIGAVVIVFAAILPDLRNIIHHTHTKVPIEPVREL
ncbi:MAG: DMT family transporter [Candidatus Saccharimonadales bacterium]